MSDQVRMTRAERQAETRNRLMAAATEVFAERGIAGATVEEICERAGFTRGAFYSNFASKDELCLAIVAEDQRQAIEVLNDSVAGSLARAGDPVEDILAALLARLPIGTAELMLHQELMLQAQRDPEFRAPFRELILRTQGQISELLISVLEVHRRRLLVDVTTASRLLEGEFMRNERDAVLFEDADGGRTRVRTALAQVVHLISEPLPPTP